MTRSEFIARLAARAPRLTNKGAGVSVFLILDLITNALTRGDRVEIHGFGSFASHRRKPRKGRNPKSGETVDIPAKYVLYFKAAKELGERVDNVKGKPF